MENRQQRRYESIRSSVLVLQQPEFQRPGIVGLRADLEKAKKALDALYLSQVSNHRSRRTDGGQVRLLREDLRKRMQRISRLAIVKLDGLPGIRQDARVPHANAKTADLVDAAARLTKNLRPHARTLYKGGLPTDYFVKLNAAAKALATKAASPDTAIARRSRATSSIPGAIKRCRDLVNALDPAVRQEQAGNELAIFAWARASRIPGRIGRPKKRPNASPPPPPDDTPRGRRR